MRKKLALFGLVHPSAPQMSQPDAENNYGRIKDRGGDDTEAAGRGRDGSAFVTSVAPSLPLFTLERTEARPSNAEPIPSALVGRPQGSLGSSLNPTPTKDWKEAHLSSTDK